MIETDLASAAIEALQSDPAHAPSREALAEARSLRAKILGLLLRKHRLAAERAPEECAAFLQVSPQTLEAWEFGAESPSLPQVELLAGYLNGEPTPAKRDEYQLLRGRIIGVLLRMARDKQAMSQDAVVAETALDTEMLRVGELGGCDIPLSDLTGLAQALHVDMRDFLEAPAGTPAQPPAPNEPAIDDATAALSEFVADSQNAAFIRLAMAFRHIKADDLHRIADALFAIIHASADERSAAP